MSVPLAPFPPPLVRASISSTDWAAIIESWNTALSLLLQLPSSSTFTAASSTANLNTFLATYCAFTPLSSRADPLRKKAFLLIHRTCASAKPVPLLTTPGFLEGFSRVYAKVPAAQRLLAELWRTHEAELEKEIKSLKKRHFPVFSRIAITRDDAVGLSRLFQLSPKIAAVFLAGDEFADAAADATGGGDSGGDVVAVKLFARAMTEAARVNWSVVIDGLYSLTTPSSGEREKALAMRLSTLGLGVKLTALADGTEYAARVEGAVQRLHELAPPMRQREDGRHHGKARDKGKGVVTPSDQQEPETTDKVDQIRDIFPDLGSGFVRRCLGAMGGDVEAVTAALLEGNLPADLAAADQTEELCAPPCPVFSTTLLFRL